MTNQKIYWDNYHNVICGCENCYNIRKALKLPGYNYRCADEQ